MKPRLAQLLSMAACGLLLGCKSSSLVEIRISVEGRPVVQATVSKNDSVPWVIGESTSVTTGATTADGATTATAVDTTQKEVIKTLGIAAIGGVGGYLAKGGLGL